MYIAESVLIMCIVLHTEERVTDTITRDPLFTVPVKIDSPKPALNITIMPQVQLCYEIHGNDGSFNLISTEHTSVNAQYSEHYITAIGIYARDNASDCCKIQVSDNQHKT